MIQQEYRSRRANCILVFLIGAFVQISIPLTDLYEVPNARGVFFAFVVAMFAFLFLSGHPIKTGAPLILLYVAVVAIWMVGISYSRAPRYGANKTVLVAAYFLAVGVVIYNQIDGLPAAKSFIYGLGLGSVILVCITMMEVGNPIQLIQAASRFFRLRFGEGGNPIMLARHLALAVTIIVTILALRRTWINVMWGVPFGLLAFVYLLATGSKGPLLALLIACVCTPILLMQGVIKRLGLVAFVVGCTLLSGMVLMEFLPKAFVQERVIEKIENLSLRLPAYKMAVNAIIDSDPVALVVGHGTGDFGYLELQKDDRAYPHNMLLEVLYENGLVGFGVIVVAIVLPIRAVMRARGRLVAPAHRALLAGLTISYIAAVTNAQVSGDLGANLLIGMFGAATVALAHVDSMHHTDA
ncbi:MAG: O-antigen ligase family protein [Nitrospira sp.]|nr:O-antigen ligase family protein [Nitrospira sp.]